MCADLTRALVFARRVQCMSDIWFIRAVFCFASGLVCPVHSLFCTWSGLSRLFSVLRVVWSIRAILCFAHGLVYQGYFLYCEGSSLSWPFSVLRMFWFIWAILCEACPMYVRYLQAAGHRMRLGRRSRPIGGQARADCVQTMQTMQTFQTRQDHRK